MQLSEFVVFHSGINKLTFLLLHETTLLGKWLQTFRQTVRSHLKRKRSKAILIVEDITTIFLPKVLETNTQ
jgi:hypothetical protein